MRPPHLYLANFPRSKHAQSLHGASQVEELGLIMRSLGRAPTELEVKEYQKSVDKGDGSFNIDGIRPLFQQHTAPHYHLHHHQPVRTALFAPISHFPAHRRVAAISLASLEREFGEWREGQREGGRRA